MPVALPLASGTRILGQNSSNARYFYNTYTYCVQDTYTAP